MESKESKHDIFLRLAEKRTNVVIDRIRILSNCANQYVYEYDEKDVRKIFVAIDEELRLAKLKFTQNFIRRNTFKLR